MTINRRDLLGTGLKLGVSGLVLTSLAPALSSCGKKEDFPQSTDEYDIWREMRDAIRTSPDHTLARSKTLVSAGDRDGIFQGICCGYPLAAHRATQHCHKCREAGPRGSVTKCINRAGTARLPR